ncbi:hypothetical protein [Nonomuraea sp. NPDC005650]
MSGWTTWAAKIIAVVFLAAAPAVAVATAAHAAGPIVIGEDDGIENSHWP